jgi:hypothetical protein
LAKLLCILQDSFQDSLLRRLFWYSLLQTGPRCSPKCLHNTLTSVQGYDACYSNLVRPYMSLVLSTCIFHYYSILFLSFVHKYQG